jgi:hypothetical protein
MKYEIIGQANLSNQSVKASHFYNGEKYIFTNAKQTTPKRKEKDRSRLYSEETITIFKAISSHYGIKQQELFRKAIKGEELVRVDQTDREFKTISNALGKNIIQVIDLLEWADDNKEKHKEFQQSFTFQSGKVNAISACQEIAKKLQEISRKLSAINKKKIQDNDKEIFNLFDSLLLIDTKPKTSDKERGSRSKKRAKIMLTDSLYQLWESKSIHLFENHLYYIDEDNLCKKHNMSSALINLVRDIERVIITLGIKPTAIISFRKVANSFNETVKSCNTERLKNNSFDLKELYKSMLELYKESDKILSMGGTKL